MADVQTPSSTPDSGRQIVEALGGHWSAKGGLCRCPAHADRSPSLSVRPGRRRLLLHCFAGCDTRDILAALSSLRLPAHAGWKENDLAKPNRNDWGSAAAIRIWSEARPLSGTPAERYLSNRGIDLAAPALRFHPRAPHGRRPLTRFVPAMIAAVRDESGVVAIHRTFLDPAGSRLASLEPPKCALGRLGAGLVRLCQEAETLGLAEGIETALSATTLFGVPCWATLGTERFRRVTLPPLVRQLVLFLDQDAAGRRAEALAREAFADACRIEARYPDVEGEDWNDVLRRAACVRT